MTGKKAIRVFYNSGAGSVMAFAAKELSAGLQALSGFETQAIPSAVPRGAALLITEDEVVGQQTAKPPPAGDGYVIRPVGRSLQIEATNGRGALHGAYHLLEAFGARFPLDGAPVLTTERTQPLFDVPPIRMRPAFERRGLVSDIMTWNYDSPERLEQHLVHDRAFIPWMATQGLNSFFFIRHAQDSRYCIEEVMPLFEQRGIDVEFGGHIIQQLLPRQLFATRPDFFPADVTGARVARGNLCVSSPEALSLVRDNALGYARDHPENRLLHVWGADVWQGAWCRCTSCGEITPQIQYMRVVNAVAEGLAAAGGAAEVAYLAYHDTLDPVPGLTPRAGVSLEWAPRERCYSHAIDDPQCARNPSYLTSLRRHLEIFEGRAHVFEYYADAILFGGLGVALPTTVARDLRAYHKLGLRSVSCLTFGQFSVFAYPVNLLAFARCSRDLTVEPDQALAEAAAQRNPLCAGIEADAYRAIARASSLLLTYGDVLRPFMPPAEAASKRRELRLAGEAMREAIARVEAITAGGDRRWSTSERALWSYGAAVLTALDDFLGARAGQLPTKAGWAAVEAIRTAMDHMRAIAPEVKGTWGTYDIEHFHKSWMDRLVRELENAT